MKDHEIGLYVREKLKLGWSPELISGRIRIEKPHFSISHESIYSYIYNKKTKHLKLWLHLTHARKKRMKKDGRRVHRQGKIPEAVSIDLRPKVIEQRLEVGHWETDLMEGTKTDNTVFSVSVERTTRFILISKLPNKTAKHKRNSLVKTLNKFNPQLLKTITSDNGLENSFHKDVSQKLQINWYFAHAYHSWEKGSVENSIGRIRRFVPKHTPLSPHTLDFINSLEFKMNHTPRKCLAFLTPHEKMHEVLKNLQSGYS